MRTLIPTVLLLSLIPFSLYASARSNSGGLAERVAELEAQVEELSAILEFVYIEPESINGLRGPHVIVEGANFHVRSGSGQTGFPACPGGVDCATKTGLGNLIVGYNELPLSSPRPRRGMHNLIVGPEHEYSGTGGFVAGAHNRIENRGNSVTGGKDNQAIGDFSSVCGGFGNTASGSAASVGGGQYRVAPGNFNWAAGSLFEAN